MSSRVPRCTPSSLSGCRGDTVHVPGCRHAVADDEPADGTDCGHHSWAGLMALLDEHWPADVFPTLADDPGRDAGARIVSLMRWVDLLLRRSMEAGRDQGCP